MAFKIKNTLVESITLSGPNGSYPVKQFSVNFAINGLPNANIAIVTGYDVYKRKWSRFSETDSSDKSEWSLTIVSSEGTREMFRGFITTVGVSAASSPVQSQVQVNIAMIGVQSQLDWYIPSAYHFWGNQTKSPLYRAANGCATAGLYELNLSEIKSITLVEGLSPTTRSIPYILIKMFEVLHGNCSDESQLGGIARKIIEDTDMRLRPYFKTTGPYGFYTKELMELLAGSWSGRSMWTILKSMASEQTFMFYLVPTISTIRMEALMPWKKASDISLSLEDTLSVSRLSDQSALFTQPQAVAVTRLFDASDSNASQGGTSKPFNFFSIYPPVEGEANSFTGPARIVAPPNWLASIMHLPYMGSKGERGKYKIENKGEAGKVQDELRAQDITIGDAVAKSYFGMATAATSSMNIRLPWSELEDYSMLGKILQLTDDSDTYFGMVSAIAITGSSTAEDGNITLNLGLSHVRNASMNDKVGLDEHPIYTTPPVGTSDSASSVTSIFKSASGSSGLGGESIRSAFRSAGATTLSSPRADFNSVASSSFSGSDIRSAISAAKRKII